MSKEITVDVRAIVMMSGAVMWVEEAKARALKAHLKAPNPPKFIDFEGQMINVSSIEGIYTPKVMEEIQRRKNGQWQCNRGKWHERNEKCECIDPVAFKKKCESAVAFYKRLGYWPPRAPSTREIERALGVTLIRA